jgi:polar amino acid transport system substrate-binding protein
VVKRAVALVVIAFAITGAALARAGKPPEPFASKGSFAVCVDVAFPPLEYYAKAGSRTPTGFDIDLARAAARRWKIKVSFVPVAFKGLLPALGAHKCDLVWSAIFVTPDRTKRFPAVGYMKTHRVLLVSKGNPKHIRNPSDLSGKVVATQAGTKYVGALKALDRRLKAQGKQGIKILTYRKDSDASAAVLAGQADAHLTQDIGAAYRITQTKGRFQIAYVYPQFDTFGVYYRRGDAAVGPALMRELAALKKNGTTKGLAKKYDLPLKDFGLK